MAALTNASGAVVERYGYDAYGKRIILDGAGTTVRTASAYGQNYGFTGREWDSETGLWYFRARMYSDRLGRFVSRDPMGYVDGYALYNGYFVPGGMDPSGAYTITSFTGAYMHYVNGSGSDATLSSELIENYKNDSVIASTYTTPDTDDLKTSAIFSRTECSGTSWSKTADRDFGSDLVGALTNVNLTMILTRHDLARTGTWHISSSDSCCTFKVTTTMHYQGSDRYQFNDEPGSGFSVRNVVETFWRRGSDVVATLVNYGDGVTSYGREYGINWSFYVHGEFWFDKQGRATTDPALEEPGAQGGWWEDAYNR